MHVVSLTVERYRTLFKPWEDPPPPYLGQTNHNLADETTAACNFTAASQSPSSGNGSFNPSPRAGRNRDALDPLEHWFGTQSEQGHDGMTLDRNSWRDRHHRVPNVTQYIASWTARQNHPSTLAVEFIFRTPVRDAPNASFSILDTVSQALDRILGLLGPRTIARKRSDGQGRRHCRTSLHTNR